MSYVPIGVIVNTHGLNGTLKVKSFTDFKELRYQKGQTLYIAFRSEQIPVTVVSYRTHKGLDYLTFEEFTNINQCEQYKGSDLLMDKSQMQPLEEGEYYYEELIGMTVVGDQLHGVVVDVRELPRGELLVVDVDGTQVLIPFHKEFVKDVDQTTNTITIIEWEGLL